MNNTNNSLLSISTEETTSKGVHQENQQVVSRTLRRYRREGFPTIPDFAQKKMIQKHLRKELEMGFNYRMRKLSIELDTALHRVREESNHTLVTDKAHLRKERIEFFANSYHEVVEKLNTLSDNFLSDLDVRFTRLEKFGSKAIREREEQRLNKSVDDFLSTLDQLVDEYKNIISEHIE